jgi:hypothetical protein
MKSALEPDRDIFTYRTGLGVGDVEKIEFIVFNSIVLPSVMEPMSPYL